MEEEDEKGLQLFSCACVDLASLLHYYQYSDNKKYNAFPVSTSTSSKNPVIWKNLWLSYACDEGHSTSYYNDKLYCDKCCWEICADSCVVPCRVESEYAVQYNSTY